MAEPADGRADPPPERRTQAQRRQHTRQSLVDAVLELAAAGEGFDALSLRKVAAQAQVAPSVFYRYFTTMDDLGLAVVEESFRRLREMMVQIPFANDVTPAEIVHQSVVLLVDYVQAHRQHLAFVARQRSAGNAVLRRAIRTEIRMISSQTATHLARIDPLTEWSVRDVDMLATVIVNIMMSAVDALLESFIGSVLADSPESIADIIRTTERQLLFTITAVPHWHSRPSAQ
jgi:AcrR family transcriptional regulator